MFNKPKPLFRFRGVDFRIHPSLWLGLLLFFVLFGGFGGERTIFAALLTCMLYLSVFLHELGHAWAASRSGLEIRNLTLWFMGGFVQVRRLPTKLGPKLMFFFAGPVVNLILGAIGFVTLEILSRSYGPAWGLQLLESFNLSSSALPDPAKLLYACSYVNIALALFNLLPIYPLDGGQMVHSLAKSLFSQKPADWISLLIGALGIALYYWQEQTSSALSITSMMTTFLIVSNPQIRPFLWRLDMKLRGRDYYAAFVTRDYELALRSVDEKLRKRNDLDRLVVRAVSLAHLQKYKKSITVSSQVIDARSASPKTRSSAFNNRGWVYSQLGELDKAQRDLERSLELIPNNSDAIVNLCRVLIGQKEYDQARNHIAALGEQPLFFLFSSLLHYRAGELEIAQSDAQACFSEHWSLLTTWSKEEIFLLLRDQLDWAKQVAVWGEKAGWPLPNSHSLLAYALWAAGSYQEALELFERLIEELGSIEKQAQQEQVQLALRLNQANIAFDAGMFDYAQSKYNWLLEQETPSMFRPHIQNQLLKIDQALSAK